MEEPKAKKNQCQQKYLFQDLQICKIMELMETKMEFILETAGIVAASLRSRKISLKMTNNCFRLIQSN